MKMIMLHSITLVVRIIQTEITNHFFKIRRLCETISEDCDVIGFWVMDKKRDNNEPMSVCENNHVISHAVSICTLMDAINNRTQPHEDGSTSLCGLIFQKKKPFKNAIVVACFPLVIETLI